MMAQSDIKRLLAYSSVEHMGLLVLGLGIGGVGAYGTMLHLVNNGLAKGLLFLAVGNVVLATGTSHAPTHTRHPAVAARVRRAAGRRTLRGDGVAAIRTLPERVHHPDAALCAADIPGWPRRCCCSWPSSSSAWPPSSSRWCTASPIRRCRGHGRAAGSPADRWRWRRVSCCSASTSPRRCTQCSRGPPRVSAEVRP